MIQVMGRQQKYGGSHILRTLVLSKVCFCPPKIILSPKNDLAPNRDVGGERLPPKSAIYRST